MEPNGSAVRRIQCDVTSLFLGITQTQCTTHAAQSAQRGDAALKAGTPLATHPARTLPHSADTASLRPSRLTLAPTLIQASRANHEEQKTTTPPESASRPVLVCRRAGRSQRRVRDAATTGKSRLDKFQHFPYAAQTRGLCVSVVPF